MQRYLWLWGNLLEFIAKGILSRMHLENKKLIKAIIGLANEGVEYEKTYHNIGAFFANKLEEFNSQHATPVNIRFFSPSGFMNQIGGPIARMLKEKNIYPATVLIIHDDSDQNIGNFKLVFGGGSAGHKGIESVISHLKTEDFWRLKIGIRPLIEPVRRKAGEFVLKKWSKEEEQVFAGLVEKAWKKILPNLD